MIEARITNQRLDFGTSKEKAKEFFAKNEGKVVRIIDTDKPSLNKRKFFEGAVVPYWFYQHPHAGWEDFSEARENIKLGFNVRYIRSRAGDLYAIPGNTGKMNREQFDQFLEKVSDGFMQNGLLFPDSDEYKAWVDSSPMVGEEYPPLLQLKEQYEREKNEDKTT